LVKTGIAEITLMSVSALLTPSFPIKAADLLLPLKGIR
jgi:hypothetical protein